MTYVDQAVLNLTESFCRRFQQLTGRTNVWLAFQLTNLSIVVYFVYAFVYIWSSAGASRLVLALFCGVLFSMLTQTIFKVPVETYENSAYQRVARRVRNPRRLRDAPLRMPFLTLSIVLLGPIAFVYRSLHLHVVLLGYSLIVLTTAVLYLLACDPLPPCPGRVREWLGLVVPSRLAPSESPSGE
jgi:hypothetical protein